METKKKIGIGVLAVMMIGMAFALGVYIANVNVTVQVDEALSTTTTTCSITGYAGETKTCTIAVNNLANVPLDVALGWTEGTNTGVSYTTDMPKTIEVASGASEIVVSFNIDGASADGAFDGAVSLTRV